jgi:predicted 3-demethylubiquinone-9 3-methyltransferase (glyoxalase superfamily)
MHMTPQRITPCLWFDNQAEEVAKFYKDRVLAAMLKMKKLDLAALKQAFAGQPHP